MAEPNKKKTSLDSSQQYLGNVYAKALMGATEASGQTEAVLAEFDSLLEDVFAKLPKFEAILASPRVPHEDKLRILDRAFAGKMSTTLLNFLKVTSTHGRLDCLRSVNLAAHHQYNEARGRVEVQIRTAEPLSDDLLSQVSKGLRQTLQSEIDVSVDIQPELIGGMVVRVGDTVYDGSVVDQLRRLRSSALDHTSQEIRRSLSRFASAGSESE